MALHCFLFNLLDGTRGVQTNWYAQYALTPLIPLPPSLPAKRGEKGERRGEVAGGEAARHLTHSSLDSPSPRRRAAWGGGKGVGLAIDGTVE